MTRLAMVLAVAACGGSAATAPEKAGGPSTAPAGNVCANRSDPMGPYSLDAALAATRYGHGGTKYSDMPSTVAKPIEVCGVSGEIQWLKAHTCADGKTIADTSVQNLAAMAGRCGSPIDLYVAPCAEGTTQVYLDMYLCGPGENFM